MRVLFSITSETRPSARMTTRWAIFLDPDIVGDQGRRGAQFVIDADKRLENGHAGLTVEGAGRFVAQEHVPAAWQWHARSPRAACSPPDSSAGK